MNIFEHKKKPSRLAMRILKHTLPKTDAEFLMDDFQDIYASKKREEGRSSAYRWYWMQVFKTMPEFLGYGVHLKLAFSKHYIKTIFRNLKKHNIHAFINITGLALGLACCILIFIWVIDEISYDRFHHNGQRIYRVVQEFHTADQITTRPATPALLAPTLKHEVPELDHTTSLLAQEGIWLIRYDNQVYNNFVVCSVDSSFFTMFDFPVKVGNPASILSDKMSVLVTEEMAQQVFGATDPMGQTLQINGNDYFVTGILHDIPHNSHLQFDCVIPFDIWRSHRVTANWNYSGFVTYVMVRENASIPELNQKINRVMQHHASEFKGKMVLQTLRSIHLHSSHHQYDYAVIGEYRYVMIFSVLAVIVLSIACINFMNLSTAQSVGRAKEVGLRKVVGANRWALMRQFLLESVIQSCIALFIGLVIVTLLLPAFNRLTEKHLILNVSNSLPVFLFSMGFTMITGLLAGVYPAVILSAFRPTVVLKGTLLSGMKRSLFRRILVIAQFALAIFLIIATLTVQHQLSFIRHKDLGYDRENLVIMMVVGEFYFHFDTYKQELLRHPNVISVARGFQPIWNEIQTTIPDWEGRQPRQEIAMQCYGAGYDYFRTWGMEIVQGRAFSKAFALDSSNYVLNETAVKTMGFESPIGKQITVDGIRGQVIGVVKDFHHTSLHNPIQPIIFRMFDSAGMAVKVRSMDSETMDHLKSVWNKAVKNRRPFENDIFAPKIDAFYRKENKLAMLFNYFSFLAIFISCLGLLGLVSFMTETRTKEIGVRKVLGASVYRLVVSLIKEYLILVVMANLIALPLGWLVMRRWLQNFAYRIEPDLWIFGCSAILALMIAVMTVIVQALRAAGGDPVKALRYE